MSKLEIKKALSDLKVNEPYSLKGKRPGFTRPERKEPTTGRTYQSSNQPLVKSTNDQNDERLIQPEVEMTSVQYNPGLIQPGGNSTSGQNNQSLKQPMVENTNGRIDQSLNLPVVEATSATSYQSSDPPVVELTSGRIDDSSKLPEVDSTTSRTHQSLNLPLVEATTGSPAPLNDRKPTKSTSGRIDQSSKLPVVDPTNSTREASRGTFMIPHEIFAYCQRLATSKNELVIFNCLLRYTLGFRRSDCEAGLQFIANWSGIQNKQNIAKALKRLMTKGLIVKIEEHDSKKLRAAKYRLPVVEDFLNGRVPVVGVTTGRIDQSSNQPLTSGSFNHPPVVETTTKKENSNKNLNKTLSPELESYFAKLPKRKCDSEKTAFAELEERFTLEEITNAFLWVTCHGAPKSGEKVHSPFAFLSKSISEVLILTSVAEAKALEKEKIAKQIAADEEKQNRTLEEEEKHWQRALSQFEIVYPDPAARNSKVKELIMGISFGKNLPFEIAKKIAIREWFRKIEKEN